MDDLNNTRNIFSLERALFINNEILLELYFRLIISTNYYILLLFNEIITSVINRK